MLYFLFVAMLGGLPHFFVEEGKRWNLEDSLAGIMAHAASVGDFDGDGDPDLFVGAFCDRPSEKYLFGRPIPNILLKNTNGRFIPFEESSIRLKARTSGSVFVDLDNDFDLDLYVSNNSKAKGLRTSNRLYENLGGKFRDRSGGSEACVLMGGRSVGVLDLDGDGLLDLFVCEDWWTGKRSRLFRNLKNFRFEDVTFKAGLPRSLPGLGVCVCDFNADTIPDIFVSQSNRLFLGREDGTFFEASSPCFRYPQPNREESPCGVTAADFDRDGDFDLVVVDHSQAARTHFFLNLGVENGIPRFKEITEEVGLSYDFPSWSKDHRHLKHAHVQAADFDNDTYVDLFVAATFAEGKSSFPFVLKNLKGECGQLRFQVPDPKKATDYFAAAPVFDANRDGRLDIACLSWWSRRRSRLFVNRGECGNWLVLGLRRPGMGVGSVVKVYLSGTKELLGMNRVTLSEGYCTGIEPFCHFGLGKVERVDIEIILPRKKGTKILRNVRANQYLLIK